LSGKWRNKKLVIKNKYYRKEIIETVLENNKDRRKYNILNGFNIWYML